MNWRIKKLKEIFLLIVKYLRVLFSKKMLYKILRLILILLVIFGGSLFVVKKLTPPDYIIKFNRECDGTKCDKIKEIDSERGASIEEEMGDLSSALERLDFFARFTFLRFDFKTTNQTQFNFVVTEPRKEAGIDIMMECGLDGKIYDFSPNSGIIFQQKSSIENIIKELGKVQNFLINCNPAAQKVSLKPAGKFIVAPNAQIQIIYNEERYYLKFLPDKLNFWLTVLQIFIIMGIFLGAYYEIKKFVKKGI